MKERQATHTVARNFIGSGGYHAMRVGVACGDSIILLALGARRHICE